MPTVINLLKEIGESIRIARKRRGKTIKRLACEVGIASSTLALVEKGSAHVSVSIYVQVLYLLGFERELRSIPKRQAW